MAIVIGTRTGSNMCSNFYDLKGKRLQCEDSDIYLYLIKLCVICEKLIIANIFMKVRGEKDAIC